MWVSAPGLDHTPPFCVLQVHVKVISPLGFASQHNLCSQRRTPRISSGSVFHLTGSRVCWLTAPRWRSRRPSGKRLYNLAGRAVRCRRGGGGTSDMCLSVYCSLGKRQVDTHQHKWKLTDTKRVCACLWGLCCVYTVICRRWMARQHLPPVTGYSKHSNGMAGQQNEACENVLLWWLLFTRKGIKSINLLSVHYFI